jgi:hypothetical protein
MGSACYVKKNSNPLRCGAHDVVLVQRTFPIDQNAPSLGLVSCYVCPVSKEVVSDRPPHT